MTMSKLGKRLIAAAREGRAIARGEADPATYRIHVPAEIDVRKIRRQLGLSQDQFAAHSACPLRPCVSGNRTGASRKARRACC